MNTPNNDAPALFAALRETQQACDVTQCPWCGCWGQNYAESEQPVAYCHHEYSLKPWQQFVALPAAPASPVVPGEPENFVSKWSRVIRDMPSTYEHPASPSPEVPGEPVASARQFIYDAHVRPECSGDDESFDGLSWYDFGSSRMHPCVINARGRTVLKDGDWIVKIGTQYHAFTPEVYATLAASVASPAAPASPVVPVAVKQIEQDLWESHVSVNKRMTLEQQKSLWIKLRDATAAPASPSVAQAPNHD